MQVQWVHRFYSSHIHSSSPTRLLVSASNTAAESSLGPNRSLSNACGAFSTRDGSPRFYFGIGYGRNYDLSPDGKRFLMLEVVPEDPRTTVNVVLNWARELAGPIPPDRRP